MNLSILIIIIIAINAFALWIGVGALAERYERNPIGWLALALVMGPGAYIVLWAYGIRNTDCPECDGNGIKRIRKDGERPEFVDCDACGGTGKAS